MLTNSFIKDKSFQLPIDGSANNPKASMIIEVCQQLSNGLSMVNCGGCGMFAVMLDSLFKGLIGQLLYIRKENLLYENGYESDWHEIFIHDGFCFDAQRSCAHSTLFRYKHIKEIITKEKSQYELKPKRFFLIKRNAADIFKDYQTGSYYSVFANQTKMGMLFHNYQKVIDSLTTKLKSDCDQTKIRFIIDNYESLLMSLAA